jgi:hypothetical protein
MRVFFIFICNIAVAFFAPEAHAGKHEDKKSGNSGTASNSTQNMPPSEVIVPSGMIRNGGAIVKTASCLTLEVGITGVQVGGIQAGVTL